MIITRTPLRMSFVGGGSDIPAYYQRVGGTVVSTTINKYVFVTLNTKFDSALRISYSKTENVQHSNEVEHPIVRAALNHIGITGGLEITTIADIPSSGSGLGSSSSFAVGLLHALHAYKGQYASAEELARESCHIEINICNAPIGKQDQYAAAYGGFNIIRFHKDGKVDVEPLICAQETIRNLQENIIVFYTGRTRSANTILAEQTRKSAESSETQQILHQMVLQTKDFIYAMQQGNFHVVGEILHEAWQLKRSITKGISDPTIEGWYSKGRASGAVGGKILGAGAGGFLMFYAPKERHPAIIHALPELRHIPMQFEPTGSRIIFYCP